MSHSKTTVNKQISMKPKTQPTLLAFQKKSESTSQTLPSRPSQRRTSEQAEFDDKLNGQGIKKPASPPWAPAQKRKFIPTWKEEFPWLVYSEQDNSMTCSICLEAPAEVAGKSLFLSGWTSFNEETLGASKEELIPRIQMTSRAQKCKWSEKCVKTSLPKR